jgi:hypothetical protein
MTIRTLNPATEERLFRQAWAWRETYPRLVRKWDMITDFDQWFAAMAQRVSIGLFTDRMIALITLDPVGDGVYECHLDCERRVNMDYLLTALLNIEQTIVEQWNIREVFGAVISRNHGMLAIARSCGFLPDGVEDSVGRLRWVRVSKSYLDPIPCLPSNDLSD